MTSLTRIIGGGLFVLAGLPGVGPGFLLVPALILKGFDAKRAVAVTPRPVERPQRRYFDVFCDKRTTRSK